MWTHRISYIVSQANFNRALSYVDGQVSYAETTGKGHFDLANDNCTVFIEAVAVEANVQLPGPPGLLNAIAIPSPQVLDAALDQAVAQGGNPSFIDGGFASAGTGATADNTPDPVGFPDFSSPESLVNQGLTDPTDEASAFGFKYDTISLASSSIPTGGNVQLNETGTLPADALYGVDWGDGSAPELALIDPDVASAVAPTLSHTYTTSGTYDERLVVIQNGALEEYNGTVKVGSVGTSPQTVQYAVPSPPSNYTPPPQPPITTNVYLAGSPYPPASVQAIPGNTSATVNWTPPPSDGSGVPIDSYTVTASPGGITTTVEAPITSADLTGLTNNTSYTFSVSATNSIGTGPPAMVTATEGAGPPPWTVNTSPSGGAGASVLNAVSCVSWNDCTAVGYDVNGSGTYQTLI